jgi:hypothetical protein
MGSKYDIRLQSGTLTPAGFNLIGTNNISTDAQFPPPATPGQPNANGDLVGTLANPFDPQLGPLADNGGPTMTRRPQIGSPVINRGDKTVLPLDDDDLDGDTITTEPLPIDQRGTVRVLGANLDIGAVEDELALKTSLRTRIGRLKNQIRRAKKKGERGKVRRLTRRLNRLTNRLGAL